MHERQIIEGSDLDSLRNDLRASLRRAKAVRRDLSGSDHETRMVLLTDSLERCIRDLTHLLLAADGPQGLFGGQAVQRGPQSHGERRSR